MSAPQKTDSFSQLGSQTIGDLLGNQTIVDPVQYLLQRNYTPSRKISDHHPYQTERSNFILRHEAIQYTVVRVYINSFDSSQIKLYYTKFEPRQKIGTICIIHGYGFGQSSSDYIEVASYFAKSGYIVNLIDLRGFGYSGGNRVNEPLKGVFSDIENLLTRCCGIGLPTYILSHGFGSLLVLALLQENHDLPISGVIAMSPLLNFSKFQNSFWRTIYAECLSYLFDTILINNLINPTQLTNNPKKLKNIYNGVFNFPYLTPSMVDQYERLSYKVKKDAEKMTYPLLICCGGQDSIQPLAEVKKLYKEVSSKEKHSFIYSKGYYQLYNDEHFQEEVLPKIMAWIQDNNSTKNKIKWAMIRKNFNVNFIKKPISKAKITMSILLIVSFLIILIKKMRKLSTF